MIKKFKNGNVTLCIKEDLKSGYYAKNDIDEIVSRFVFDEMFMSDLYFEANDGVLVIHDQSNGNIYDSPTPYIKDFCEILAAGKLIRLHA